jgi:hypothetical protein
MFDSSHSARSSHFARKYAWACLLLSVLFLYNPFLATQGSSGALAVGHRQSYRATVASSELLRFGNPESNFVISIADGDLFSAITIFEPQLQSFAGLRNSEDAQPGEQLLSGNLWFRPPPAA